MKDETAQIEQHVRHYWYIDGIGELIGGGGFLILALYFAGEQYFGRESLVGNLLQAVFVLVVIGVVFTARRLINILKERLTYPRTGYVEYRQSGKSLVWMRILSFMVAIGVAIAAVFIAQRIDAIDSMVAVSGVLVAVILLIKPGWTYGVKRFYFFSLLSLLLGLALSISGLARGYNLGLFYGLMATLFTVSGGLTLRRYLSENPMPVENNNE